MLSFDEYVVQGGKIQNQDEFEELEPMVVNMIDSYIKSTIPYWRVKNIDEYTELSLEKVIVNQIDYISSHGGIDAFYGNSDMNLTGAKTNGFSYKVENKKGMSFYDIPWSTLAIKELDYQLLSSGLGGAILC